MEGQEGGEKDRTRKKILAMASLKYVGKRNGIPSGYPGGIKIRQYCMASPRPFNTNTMPAQLLTPWEVDRID